MRNSHPMTKMVPSDISITILPIFPFHSPFHVLVSLPRHFDKDVIFNRLVLI